MGPTRYTFEVAARSETTAPFRRKLRILLENSDFDAEAVRDILLSVDEALTNVIRHAYKNREKEKKKGEIRLTFSDLGDRAEILIEDKGSCFDPCKAPLPELPSKKPGGLGIYLFRSLMDEVNYQPLKPQGNQLRLVKYKKGRKP